MPMITETHDEGESKLISRADLKSVLSTLADEVADRLIDEASAMIGQYTGRVLHAQDVTEMLRNVCTDRLVLARWPVTEIVSVTEGTTLVDAADYETDGTLFYRLSNDVRVAWRVAKLTVRYTGGYATVPADLKRACLDLCVNLNAMEGRDASVRSQSIPDVESISYRDLANGGWLMPDHVMKLIDPYREIRL